MGHTVMIYADAVRYEVLTTTLPKIQIFWDVTLQCQARSSQHFKGSSCLQLQSPWTAPY